MPQGEKIVARTMHIRTHTHALKRTPKQTYTHTLYNSEKHSRSGLDAPLPSPFANAFTELIYTTTRVATDDPIK